MLICLRILLSLLLPFFLHAIIPSSGSHLNLIVMFLTLHHTPERYHRRVLQSKTSMAFIVTITDSFMIRSMASLPSLLALLILHLMVFRRRRCCMLPVYNSNQPHWPIYLDCKRSFFALRIYELPFSDHFPYEVSRKREKTSWDQVF